MTDEGSASIEVTATSENGDLSEALTLAIDEAKQKLTTDFIRWDLVHLSGEYGGAVGQTHLNVTIAAKGPE